MAKCKRRLSSRNSDCEIKGVKVYANCSNWKYQSESDILALPDVLKPLSRLIKTNTIMTPVTKDVEITGKLKTNIMNNNYDKVDKDKKPKCGKKILRDFRLFGMNDYDIIPCTSSLGPQPSSKINKSTERKYGGNGKQLPLCSTPVLPMKRKSDGDIVSTNTKCRKIKIRKSISEPGLTYELIKKDILQKNVTGDTPFSKDADHSSIINISYGTPLTIFKKQKGVELSDVSFSQSSSEQECDISNVVENIISDLNVNKDPSSQSKCGSQVKAVDTSQSSSEITPSVLKGVTIFVEVRNEFEDISEAVAKQLVRLGATVSKTLTKKVTHVVFKDGRPSTQKKALSQGAHMVSVLWVEMCRQKNEKVDEKLYPSYLKESPHCLLFPKKNKRFRCMQPKNFKEEFARSAEKLKEIFSRVKKTHADCKTPSSSDENTKENGELNECQDFATPGKMKILPPIQKRTLFGDSTEPLNLSCPLKRTEYASYPNDLEDNLIMNHVKEKISGFVKPSEKQSSKGKELTSQKKKLVWKKTPEKCKVSQTTTNKSNDVLKERSGANQARKAGVDNKVKPLIMIYTVKNSGKKLHVHSKNDLKNSRMGNQLKLKISTKETVLNDDDIARSNGVVDQIDLCFNSEAASSGQGMVDLTTSSRRVSKSSLDDFKLIDKKWKKQVVKKDSKSGHTISSERRRTLKISVQDLVLTSISLSEEDSVRSIVKTMGGFNLSETFTPNTTHVICGSKKRTLKVLFALACGCWLLSPQWVFKSLEAGCWLEEELYELVDYFPAASLCRMQKTENHPDNLQLFCDLGLIYISPLSNPPKDKMSQLITLAGGKVTNSLQRCSLAVGTFDRDTKCSAVVPEKWILDCITNHKILPFALEIQPPSGCGA